MQTETPSVRIMPVLLSGADQGGLWPLARGQAPSQLQPLFGPRSPLQEAVVSLDAADLFAPPIVVAPAEQRFLVAQQVQATGVVPAAILLEPTPRGALAALAAAVAWATRRDGSSVLLAAPSDQSARPQDRAALRRALRTAASSAVAGDVVSFACPAKPWLRNRAPIAGRLLDAGWLLGRADVLAETLDATAPELWAVANRAVDRAAADLDFHRLDAEAFGAAPTIDFAELTAAAGRRRVVHALDFAPVLARDWADLLAARRREQDAAGNIVDGDALLVDTRNCLVRSENRLTTLAGVEDLAVVVTDDAVLVANLRDPAAVRTLADRLAAGNRPEADVHPMEHRPWGEFKRLTVGPRYQVKRITVKPGGATSLQMHHHRAEHWVVVAGTAEVTVGGETRLLRENEAAYLPLGMAHRLANPGRIPLELIEVQSGAYLGEDDIQRLDDPYRREAV